LIFILSYRSAELAYKWGTIDNRDELLTEPRPLYKVNKVKFCSFSKTRMCEQKWPKYPWFSIENVSFSIKSNLWTDLCKSTWGNWLAQHKNRTIYALLLLR